ncbi:MAG: hypothetical protein HYV76_02275 [Candidatus Vogelbacteria bacterium]|nr:hypothetical protein [Candidatus Vogelbacteria bacterium]
MIRYLLAIICLFSLTSSMALAYVAASSNYRLQSDSINFAGVRSNSANFVMEDTVGELGTGTSTSASYNLHAGYQAMQGGTLSITAPADVTLSGTITDTDGGQANGSATWTVSTDNAAGYTLAIKAGASPAFTSSGNNFANYGPTGVDPDFTWTVAATAKEFGFTPEGTDIVAAFKDNGTSCNAGSSDTASSCWTALTTTDQTISRKTSATSGTDTLVRFRAEAGASATPATGVYSAAITVTATAL